MLRPLLCAALAGLAACGGADRPPPRPTAAVARPAAGPATIAFRVARSGGPVRAYAWPALDSAFWQSETPLPPVARVLGFAPVAGRLVLQGAKGAVLWLDVRRNVLLPPGPVLKQAIMTGASGDVVGIDAAGMLVRWSANGLTWRVALAGPITALQALADGSLVAVGTGARGAEAWRWSPPDTGTPTRAPVPRGALLAGGGTGGRVWVASTGAMRGLAPKTLADVTTLAGFPASAPLAVTTTPSGHLVLAVYEGGARVELVDRDRALHAPAWGLPGAARDLRMDPLGRVVLVRPVQGESAWAVDVASGQVRSTLSSSWRDDLPLVAPDGSVLVVLGPDVSRLDATTLQRAGTVPGGALDWWHVATWDGFSSRGADAPPPVFAGMDSVAPDALDSAIAAAESTAQVPSAPAAPGDSSDAPVSRWLVSFASLVDPERAEALATQLRTGGAAARVVAMTGARGPVYRVVLGPFETRDAAVRAGRATGRDHWIVPDTP